MIAVKYSGKVYSATLTPSGKVIVTAGAHIRIAPDELGAYAWLGGHGLRGGRIRRLLDAAIRNAGEFANPEHPKRVQFPHHA